MSASDVVGLVDLHCHGALGEEFGSSEAGTRRAIEFLAAEGVERVVASLVSAPEAVLVDRVSVLAPLVAEGVLAGVHLEGPFLSPARRGAHDPAALVPPRAGLVERLADVAAAAGAPNALQQWTFAPELPGAHTLIAALARRGIRPAIGHTDADATTVTRAVEHCLDATGRAPIITHLFNGMPPFHHRAGGPVAAALGAAGRGEAVVELIADGVHVAADVVRMVFETIGPHRIALVSDAMAATGLGDGDYLLGSMRVRVRQGTARIADPSGPDGGAIAGSTSTLARCLTWAVEVAGVDPDAALASASTTPAALLT
ncbi:MAG: amidohydrolase family protein [Kineosporiaceae bacterium]|nr:amidohydrolase family protein [Kineosporiaceae bacterium]